MGVMRRTLRRVTRPSRRTRGCALLLSTICALLLLVGCAEAPGAALPSSTGAAASHRLSLLTCPAARAAIPTPLAAPPTTPPGAHRSYARLALGPLPLQLVYHPGVTVRMLWCALPDLSLVSTQPIPELLTAGLVGPFATRAAAIADEQSSSPPPGNGPPHSFPPPGPIAASASPIHTTTWSGADASTSFILPATLAPGYYLFFAQDDVSTQVCLADATAGCRGGGGVGHVVQITRA